MLNLPPETEELESYPLTPEKDRWIFNKLLVAERLGYDCGPSGVPMTKPGSYCFRPVMNFMGNSYAGHFKFEFDGVNQPEIIPGWFWCEWFDGDHEWVEFTDGNAVNWYHTAALPDRPRNAQGRRKWERHNAPVINKVPAIFNGISKHLLIEHIGGKIIELAPRHSIWTYSFETSDFILMDADPAENQITSAVGQYWAEVVKI